MPICVSLSSRNVPDTTGPHTPVNRRQGDDSSSSAGAKSGGEKFYEPFAARVVQRLEGVHDRRQCTHLPGLIHERGRGPGTDGQDPADTISNQGMISQDDLSLFQYADDVDTVGPDRA